MGYVIDAVQVLSSVLVIQILSSAANDFQRILLIKQFARFPKKYTHKQTYFVERGHMRMGYNIILASVERFDRQYDFVRLFYMVKRDNNYGQGR